RAQLEIFCFFLSPIVLSRLGPQLRRGLSGTLRRATGQPVRQLRQLVPLAVQLAVVQQRLSPGAPLGPQETLDAHEGTVLPDPAADGGQPDAYPARPAHDGIDRGLLQRPHAQAAGSDRPLRAEEARGLKRSRAGVAMSAPLRNVRTLIVLCLVSAGWAFS